MGPEVARLTGLHAAAQEERAEALLDLGRVAEAVAAAAALVAAEPLRGVRRRGADAGAGCRRPARGGAAGLRPAPAGAGRAAGADPSPELPRLHEQVLRQELPRRRRLTPAACATDQLVRRPGRRPRPGRRGVADAAPGGDAVRARAASARPGWPGTSPRPSPTATPTARWSSSSPRPARDAVPAAWPPRCGSPRRRRAEPPSDGIVEVLAVRQQLLVLDDCEHVCRRGRRAGRGDHARAPPGRPCWPPAGSRCGWTASRCCRSRRWTPDAAARAARRPDPRRRPRRRTRPPTDRAGRAIVRRGSTACRWPWSWPPPGCPRSAWPGCSTPSTRRWTPLGPRPAHRPPPRHRSLRDVVEWSYGLLDDEQRDALRPARRVRRAGRAGRGGAVCGDAGRCPTSWTARSCVRSGGAPVAFGMLETLRAFGRARLATDPARPRAARPARRLGGRARPRHRRRPVTARRGRRDAPLRRPPGRHRPRARLAVRARPAGGPAAARSRLRRAGLPAGPGRPGAARRRGAHRRRLRAGRARIRTAGRPAAAPAAAPAARRMSRACRCGSAGTSTAPSAGAGARWRSPTGPATRCSPGTATRCWPTWPCSAATWPAPRQHGDRAARLAVRPGTTRPALMALVDLPHHRGLRRRPRRRRALRGGGRRGWPSAWARRPAGAGLAYAARGAPGRGAATRPRRAAGAGGRAGRGGRRGVPGRGRPAHAAHHRGAGRRPGSERCPGSARCWTPGTAWAPGRSCGSRCGRWPRRCPGAAGTPTPRVLLGALRASPRAQHRVRRRLGPGAGASRTRPGRRSVPRFEHLPAEGAALGDAGAVALARRLARWPPTAGRGPGVPPAPDPVPSGYPADCDYPAQCDLPCPCRL